MPVTYNHTFFTTKTLRESAKRYLKHLPTDVDHLLSRGMSGCAIASAMITLSERPLKQTVVRKAHEAAHLSYAGVCPVSQTKVAIVDDLIATGETVRAILSYAERNNLIVKVMIVDHCENPFDDLPEGCQLIILREESGGEIK